MSAPPVTRRVAGAAGSAAGVAAVTAARLAARRPPASWGGGLLTLVAAVGSGLVLLGAPAVLAWVGAGFPGDVPAVLRAAAAIWLVGHGSGAVVDGVPITVVPLGLAAVPLVLLHRAARSVATVRPPRGGLDIVRIVAGTTAGLATLAAVLAVFVSGGGSVVVAPGRAAAAATLVGLLGVGSGLAAVAAVRSLLPWRGPLWLRGAVRAAALATMTVVTGAAVLAMTTLVLNAGRVLDVLGGLHAGPVGGLLLTLAGAAVLPNLVGWAAAVAVGPGVTVGPAAVAVTGSGSGLLPALPVLGALPPEVPTVLGVAALTVPVLAGALAGWWLHLRCVTLALASRVGVAALAGVTAGGLLGLVAIVSGGAAGDGRLADVGAVAWQVAAAGAVQIGVAAVCAVTALYVVARPVPTAAED